MHYILRKCLYDFVIHHWFDILSYVGKQVAEIMNNLPFKTIG